LEPIDLVGKFVQHPHLCAKGTDGRDTLKRFSETRKDWGSGGASHSPQIASCVEVGNGERDVYISNKYSRDQEAWEAMLAPRSSDEFETYQEAWQR
jgi:hypothetical protein